MKKQIALYNAMLLDQPLTDRQKDEIAQFICDCLGNMDFNIAVMGNKTFPSDTHALSNVLDITFHTRWWNEFNSAYERACASYNALVNKQTISEEEKISLREYAILQEMASLMPIFRELGHLDIINRNQTLDQCHEKIKKCHEIMNFLQLKLKIASQPAGYFEKKQLDACNKTIAYFFQLVETFIKDPREDFSKKPNLK